MNTRSLHPGDRVKINRKGEVFSGTLTRRLEDGRWLIEDSSPRSTYLHIRPQWIVEQVDVQQRLGVGV